MTHFEKEGSELLEQGTRSAFEAAADVQTEQYRPTPSPFTLSLNDIIINCIGAASTLDLNVCVLISRSCHSGPEQNSLSFHFLCSSVCLTLFFTTLVSQQQKSHQLKERTFLTLSS